jgi:hypothetical protein
MAEVTYVGRLVQPEVPDGHWADGLERVVEVHGGDGSVQRLHAPGFDAAVDWLGWGPGMASAETACALLENLVGEDTTLDLVVDLAETFETLAADRGWALGERRLRRWVTERDAVLTLQWAQEGRDDDE